MSGNSFVFDIEQFNKLFPFYLMIDEHMNIISAGKSLLKIGHIEENQSFSSLFSIVRPEVTDPEFQDLKSLCEQLVIMEFIRDRELIIRGQFEELPYKNALVFIGSPWFGTMDQVRKKNLTLHDFALHDPMIDLLHVVKTQELATEELKQLLSTIRRQKDELKKAAKEIHDIALFPMQNPDPLFRIDTNGEILIMNPAAMELKSFVHKGIMVDAVDFWKLILPEIDREVERWYYEAKSNDKIYSFAFKYLENEKYFNIYGRDITQAKIRDENLRLLSLIAEENINAVVICNADGRIEWVNKSYMEITGYSLEELTGEKPGPMLQGPESDPETINYLREQIRKGDPFNCEIINYSRTGRKYWIRILGQSLRNDEGKITGYFALEEDITSEKEAQQKLKEIESRFRLALEKIGDNVWEYDFLTNKTVFSNPENNFLGLLFGNLNNNNKLWWDSVHKDDLNILIANDKKCRSGEIDSHILEYRMVLPDGSIKWVLDRGVVIEKGLDGKPLRMIGTHSDVTNQKNVEQALKSKEEKYRNIINNINLGLLEVDNEDRIQYANQRFCTMSGYTPDEILGKKATDVFTRPEFRELIESKNDLRKKGISDAYEVSVYDKMGNQRWWLISGAPNYNDEGILTGSIGIHLDITEQKMLEIELKQAKDRAEESSKAKETFLANMSHEIRTPLNAIIGMVRELTREQLTPKQNYFLNNAKTAAEHLLSIINNILDISKIEAGEFHLEQRHFSLREIIEETALIMSAVASEKMLDLEINISDNIYPVFIGDPVRIRQILINILGNAIKFTEKGKITIGCQSTETEGQYKRILLSITDTGIGMDEMFMKNLFKKFSQEDDSTARKYGGTGLGMAITYELVQLMKGTINVKSEKGEGTKIDIQLRLLPGESDKIESETRKDSFDKLRNIRILLVEDNEMNRLVARSTLANYGIHITESENGLEALKRIKEEVFDIILMDLQMPVMDGISATRIIRDELKNNVPIIALTANAFKNELDQCIAAGMNDYVIKPFEENTLLRTLLKNTGKISSFLPVDIYADNAVSVPGKLYDLNKLFEISRGDESFVKKMVHLFVDQIPPSVQRIKSAFESGDYSTVKSIAHRIRPSIENMGIHSVKLEIRQIEQLASDDPTSGLLPSLISKAEAILNESINQLLKEYPI